jgi:hypothetical protein
MYNPSIAQNAVRTRKKTKIYVGGFRRPVGVVVGDEFRKSIKSETGYLREPPAICFDVQSLRDAEQAGARFVVITNKDDGRVHRASIAKIWRDGFSVNRGFGQQIGLSLSNYETISAPTQLRMF